MRFPLPLLLVGLAGPALAACRPNASPAPAPTDSTAARPAAEAPVFTYLSMDGEFEMDPVHRPTRADPRNPSRLRLSTTADAGTATRMAFYAHDDPNRLVADCGYQFAGSRPDPHYFPAESKTSIWDVFTQTTAYGGACDAYTVVVARSPHGDPVHMHLRYGTNADALLAMSTAPVDSAAFTPWWPVYCAPGRTTTCD